MNRMAAYALMACLVLVFLGTVLCQVLIPYQANLVAADFPEAGSLVVPYSAAAIAFVVCVQISLVMVWLLLGKVVNRSIFTDGALIPVNVIIWCVITATALSAVVLLFMGFGPDYSTGGGAGLFMLACVVGGTALALLMVVMRGLLKAAIEDRTELSEVI